MFSHVSVHPYIHQSVCLSTPGGRGTPTRSSWGDPLPGGYPTLGTPHQTWPGSTSCWGTLLWLPPSWTWLGVPPSRGYGILGTPHQTWLGGTPPWVTPCRIWLGGYPLLGGYSTSGTPWLDLGGGYPTSENRWST